MFPLWCRNLHLLPMLSSWPAFHRCHHAQDGRKLPEVCHREDSNIIHNDLCPSRWNTWQPVIHHETYCLLTFGIPSSSSSLSIHSRRSRHHTLLSVLYPFRNPPLQLHLAISGFLVRIPHFNSQWGVPTLIELIADNIFMVSGCQATSWYRASKLHKMSECAIMDFCRLLAIWL